MDMMLLGGQKLKESPDELKTLKELDVNDKNDIQQVFESLLEFSFENKQLIDHSIDAQSNKATDDSEFNHEEFLSLIGEEPWQLLNVKNQLENNVDELGQELPPSLSVSSLVANETDKNLKEDSSLLLDINTKLSLKDNNNLFPSLTDSFEAAEVAQQNINKLTKASFYEDRTQGLFDGLQRAEDSGNSFKNLFMLNGDAENLTYTENYLNNKNDLFTALNGDHLLRAEQLHLKQMTGEKLNVLQQEAQLLIESGMVIDDKPTEDFKSIIQEQKVAELSEWSSNSFNKELTSKTEALLSQKTLKLEGVIGTVNWSANFAKSIKTLLTQQIKEAKIEVDPPELGPIQIKLAINQQDVNVQFQTQSGATKDHIENALPKLKEMLEESGYNLLESHVNQEQSGNRSGNSATSEETLSFKSDELQDSELEEVINQELSLDRKGVDFFA
ncbi:MAG: flagellar hook-length control protein FliK [Pseudomonadota bacterium]